MTFPISATVRPMIETVGQLVGALPLILSVFVYLYNDRNKTLGFKLASDLLWAIHFALLGQWSGAAINVINSLRGALYFQKGRWRWASGVWIPIFFLVISIVCTVFTATGFISILPLVGSGLAVFGHWCSSPRMMRYFNLPAVTLWLIYAILTGSVASIICNTVFIITQLVALLRHKKDTP